MMPGPSSHKEWHALREMCAKVKTMPAARCSSDRFTQLPRCSGYRSANAKTKGVSGA